MAHLRLYAKTRLFILCVLLMISYCENTNLISDSPDLESQCDLFIENGLCMYDGETVITPPPTVENLILFLTFDQSANLDQSGRGHHASGSQNRGPPLFLSQGYSGHFQGDQNIVVPANSDVNTALAGQFSMTFWVFINAFNTLTTEQCNIIEQGDQERSGFAFTVEMATRQVMVTVETEVGPQTLTSNGRLLTRRWTHIALFKTNSLLVLYVNGNLDAVAEVQPSVESRSNPLYIGRMPWQDFIGNGCTLDFNIDEFKLFNSAIEESYIEAEAGIALGAGIDPHSLELGCINCSMTRAEGSCTDEYHLCTTVEMYSFAFAAAKSMGWLRSGQRVWSDRSSESGSSDLGLALCCRNY